MSRYEFSKTNGQYGGLSYYYGLGGRDKDRRGRKADSAASLVRRPTPEGDQSAKRMPAPIPIEKKGVAEILQSKAIQLAKRSEAFEKRGEADLARGRDTAAAALLKRAEIMADKSKRDEALAKKIPYKAEQILMPKALMKDSFSTAVANAGPVTDTGDTGIPVTSAPTVPVLMKTTLPLTPPPILLPPAPMGPGYGPGYGPPMMGPPMSRPRMMPTMTTPRGPTVTPNMAATAAALAAGYLFFL
ncbi:hypothetical protein C4588_04775 [Candidatus Parcubacteria bacterium]|nr:MAG: hypothetical protein C4588_04775 [Candidatus Parcubacteria bacterium]